MDTPGQATPSPLAPRPLEPEPADDTWPEGTWMEGRAVLRAEALAALRTEWRSEGLVVVAADRSLGGLRPASLPAPRAGYVKRILTALAP